MAAITRAYPGKSADEIYRRVHAVMGEIASELSLAYRSDASARTGEVSRMGMSGGYQVRDGEVSVEVKFPMLVPGALRRRVEAEIRERLEGLFG